MNLYDQGMSTLTIGQVAERTGFTPAALRFYDERGLVTPSRSDGGYRLYGGEALDRLAFIARAKQLGCSLDEIADLLAIWDGQQCAPVQTRFHELVTHKILATQTQIAELVAFAAQLQAAAGRLAATPIDEPCGDSCACLAHDVGEPVAVDLQPSSDVPIACTLEPGAMPDRLADWTRSSTPRRRDRAPPTVGSASSSVTRSMSPNWSAWSKPNSDAVPSSPSQSPSINVAPPSKLALPAPRTTSWPACFGAAS